MIRATTRWILTALVWMLLWPADAGSQSAALIEARDTYVALGKQKKYAEPSPSRRKPFAWRSRNTGLIRRRPPPS